MEKKQNEKESAKWSTTNLRRGLETIWPKTNWKQLSCVSECVVSRTHNMFTRGWSSQRGRNSADSCRVQLWQNIVTSTPNPKETEWGPQGELVPITCSGMQVRKWGVDLFDLFSLFDRRLFFCLRWFVSVWQWCVISLFAELHFHSVLLWLSLTFMFEGQVTDDKVNWSLILSNKRVGSKKGTQKKWNVELVPIDLFAFKGSSLWLAASKPCCCPHNSCVSTGVFFSRKIKAIFFKFRQNTIVICKRCQWMPWSALCH